MATQYTNILKLALPVQGELTGTWGETINDEITSLVEQAIAGMVTVDTWVTNAHTLTVVNGATSESRAAILKLTDTAVALTAAGEVVCPDESKTYCVINGTLQAITVKTAAGTGVVISPGVTKIVICDATNVLDPIGFNNTTSGLTATTLQGAVDEVEARVEVNETDISGLQASVNGAVPITRTVNGYALSANISLDYTDVNALPDTYVPTIASVTGLQAELDTLETNTTTLDADIKRARRLALAGI